MIMTHDKLKVISLDGTRVYGMLRHFQDKGWKFFPYVSGHAVSRKYWVFAELAIPRWVPSTAKTIPYGRPSKD